MTVVGPVLLKEFRRLDLNSAEQGVPVSRLMANAGKALADAIRAAHDKHGSHVVLLCGKGNNGGDGYAAAGLLERWGIPYTILAVDAPSGHESRAYHDLLPAAHIKPWKGTRKNWSQVIAVDCLLGSGIRDAPRAPYDAAIRWINKQRHVIACDIPSGLGTRLSVKPHTTVTFHAKKDGMTKANSGNIVVAPIGIPAAAADIGMGDLDAGFIQRRDAHKGDNGRVLIIGGGPFTGAPHYAGMGAVRAGADLVHVATTAAAATTISAWGPDLLIHAVDAGPHLSTAAWPAIRNLLDRVDCVVIGPGLGDHPESLALVRFIIDTEIPTVVDADALDAVRDGDRCLVLTPHGREFQDLSGWKPTKANVTKYADKTGHIVLRKGAEDVVAGRETRVCKRGHPGMTVGGTGDVLAGALGALIARGAEPFDAACAAAYLVGCAGEIAGSMFGEALTATDVIHALPAVLRTL